MKPLSPINTDLPLTAEMLDTYQMIRAYCAEHGWPPTYREIAAARGYSVSAVVHQLRRLEAAGYISRLLNRPRTLTLLKP